MWAPIADERWPVSYNNTYIQPSEYSQQGELQWSQGDIQYQNVGSVGKWVEPDRRWRYETEPYYQSLYTRKYFSTKDWNLPMELKTLFMPLKCNLCNCSMGSTVTAKDHYDGKKHNANIKKWLNQHPEFDGKYFLTETVQLKVVDPERLYCRTCDIMLSSEQQAQSHYMGKKHQSVVNGGHMRNAYYNVQTGQWERCITTPVVNGQPRYGLPFIQNTNVKEISPNHKYYCDMCEVACPSQITFNNHLSGSKHRRKLAMIHGADLSPGARENLLEEASKTEKKVPPQSDLSIYRTPSGKYYCHSCNVTVNSPIQFVQHSESKKHKQKCSSILPATSSRSLKIMNGIRPECSRPITTTYAHDVHSRTSQQCVAQRIPYPATTVQRYDGYATYGGHQTTLMR